MEELKEEEMCGCELVCCKYKSRRCACSICQSLATAKWALLAFCFASLLFQTVTHGMIGVTISTIEKRFELQSTETGLMASMYDIGIVLVQLFILFVREDIHKPKWCGIGIMICALGSILFSMPHFIAPTYIYIETETMNFCGNVTIPDCFVSSIRNFRFVFIFSVIVIGLGASSLSTQGVAYFDENVKKENSALYISIFYSMGGLGPAVGYICGGAALELYTTWPASTDHITIDSSSDLWIGAWWLGFFIGGFALLLVAIPLVCLPKYLPGTEQHRKNRNLEAQKCSMKEGAVGDAQSPGVLMALRVLLKNKPYVFATFGNAVNLALIYGFNTFGAKYVEFVYGLKPFHASLVYGITAIFASTGGQFFGGFFVTKFSMTFQQITKFMIGCGCFSVLCSLGLFVHCEDIDVAGGTVPYMNSTLTRSPDAPCNELCGCSTDNYEPVCGDGVLYFSPCYAGCSVQTDDMMYSDCVCMEASGNRTATLESCEKNPCTLVAVGIIVVFLCFFSSLLTVSPTTQITLRSVPFNMRQRALSLQRIVIFLLGVTPGRIITGVVFDLACVMWSTDCGEQGSCRAYNRWELARNAAILLLAQTTICVICYILIYVTYEPVEKEDSGNASGEDGNGNLPMEQLAGTLTTTVEAPLEASNESGGEDQSMQSVDGAEGTFLAAEDAAINDEAKDITEGVSEVEESLLEKTVTTEEAGEENLSDKDEDLDSGQGRSSVISLGQNSESVSKTAFSPADVRTGGVGSDLDISFADEDIDSHEDVVVEEEEVGVNDVELDLQLQN